MPPTYIYKQNNSKKLNIYGKIGHTWTIFRDQSDDVMKDNNEVKQLKINNALKSLAVARSL